MLFHLFGSKFVMTTSFKNRKAGISFGLNSHQTLTTRLLVITREPELSVILGKQILPSNGKVVSDHSEDLSMSMRHVLTSPLDNHIM